MASVFMALVGLSMPAMFGTTAVVPGPRLGWREIALQVLAITAIINLEKRWPAFDCRRETHWRERLGVAIGLRPRGQSGAGALAVSLSCGIGGSRVAVPILSLALNLTATGVFMLWVKQRINAVPKPVIQPKPTPQPIA